MNKQRWIAMTAACAVMSAMVCMQAPAANIRIIGTDESEVETEAEAEPMILSQGQVQVSTAQTAGTDETEADVAAAGEQPLNPAEEGITAEDAVNGARTLYSQMQHYADVNDNSNFVLLFEPRADAQTVQDQLQSVKSSLSDLQNLGHHADMCFYDPTADSTQSPYYFAVALCDYDVDLTGAVAWYSTLMKVAKYEDGWHASISPASDLLRTNYPDGFLESDSAGYNTADLYPSLGMRFASGAVFEGALYALPNLLWQDAEGNLDCAVWIANGTDTSKWCDTIDLIVKDTEAGDVTKVNVPVQTALDAGQSAVVNCVIPAEYVESGNKGWTEVSVSSNLKFQ